VVINCNRYTFIWCSVHSSFLLLAYKHTGFHMSDMCAIYVDSWATADERKILHSQYTLHSHAEGTGFGTCEPEGSPTGSISDTVYGQGQQWVSSETSVLQRMRNIVIKYYCDHTYDCKASVQRFPRLRLHSAHIQPVPLRKRIMFRVSQILRHNTHQNCSWHCPLAFRRVQYTHLEWAPGQRMTVKHKTHQWWLCFT
jgi:hypothetical protein